MHAVASSYLHQREEEAWFYLVVYVDDSIFFSSRGGNDVLVQNFMIHVANCSCVCALENCVHTFSFLHTPTREDLMTNV